MTFNPDEESKLLEHNTSLPIHEMDEWEAEQLR